MRRGGFFICSLRRKPGASNVVSRVSPPKSNRKEATHTEAPASGDDGSIPAFLLRNSDEQVAAANGTSGGTGLPVVADSPSGARLLILEKAKRELAEAKREAVRSGAGSRKKSPVAVARAPSQRRECGEPKRTYLQNCLLEISAVCRCDEEMELRSELDEAEIDTAIVKIKEVIGELCVLLGRLEEARPHQ
jgi:hypothetical protein